MSLLNVKDKIKSKLKWTELNCTRQRTYSLHNFCDDSMSKHINETQTITGLML